VFLSVANGLPIPPAENIDQALAASKEALGYEVFGYWHFMSAPDGPKLMEENV
jgi:hypothetical protein